MNENNQNLWGGRFTAATDATFIKFNRSFNFDVRLFSADLLGSSAHCEGLRKAGILTDAESAKIQNGLQTLYDKSTKENYFFADSSAEDVHSFIESKLIAEIGDVGRKIHTGRSRNDQVSTALRVWLREAIDKLQATLTDTQKAFVELAEKHETAILSGYTHLQRAQPILFAHWGLAYFEMLKRDSERLTQTRGRVNVLPLGSAALAGSSYDIDREAVAKELNFDSITQNSLDAVSDRDFCVDFVHAASLIMVHLSRFAEDVILYTTTEFGFFELGEAVSTGSSIMPQKKNPDSLELVRGKSGRVFGHLTSLLTTLKGLPLAYNKDLQEDKQAVFDTFDTVRDCLQITTIVLQNLRVNEKRTREAAMTGYLNATELADYLAKKGVTFREAHEIVGKIVLRAIELEVELNEMDLTEMQKLSSQIETDVYQALSLKSTLSTKNVIGGTSPEQVRKQLEKSKAQESFGSPKSQVQESKVPLN
ncbi:MAG: argininosuccinate lyase [Pyrinomonadaceae bacterium]|nr:argininosuccinate lyase [Pyrinomonadaceae bacterium]